IRDYKVTGVQTCALPIFFRYDASFSDSGIGAAVVHRAPIEGLLRAGSRSLADLQMKIAHGGPQSFAIPGARAVLTTEVEREEREIGRASCRERGEMVVGA